MKLRTFSFFFLALAVSLFARDIPEEWDVEIEVNQLDPTADDDDATTPFKTINAAAQNALGFARAGRNVRVLIHPGVYRENVELIGEPDVAEGWIKLEGTEPGKVVLNGTDILNGWDINDRTQFEVAWSREKDFITYVQGEEKYINPMVFVEGARMLEVDSASKVRPGKVFFGEEKIFLKPPKGAVVTDGKVEIGRPLKSAIRAVNLDHFYVENLALERGFKHGIDFDGFNEEVAEKRVEYNGPVSVVVVNNVSAEYARCNGIVVRLAKLLRMRRVFADRCGWGGISVDKTKEVAVTGTEAGLNGWATLDAKDDVYREVDFPTGVGISQCLKVKFWSLRVAENHGSGLFLEQAGGEASLGKITAANNAWAGVVLVNLKMRLRYLEPEMEPKQPPKYGKVTLSESEIVFNEKYGLVLSENTTALVNSIYGNKLQVLLSGNATLMRNIIVAEEEQGLVVVKEKKPDFTAQQNLYYSDAPKAFYLTSMSKNQEGVTFSQWQEETGQDLNSYFGEPKLLDPENYQFTPHPSSPWFDMRNWPVRKLD